MGDLIKSINNSYFGMSPLNINFLEKLEKPIKPHPHHKHNHKHHKPHHKVRSNLCIHFHWIDVEQAREIQHGLKTAADPQPSPAPPQTQQ